MRNDFLDVKGADERGLERAFSWAVTQWIGSLVRGVS